MIALLARRGSAAVFGYIRDAPLSNTSATARRAVPQWAQPGSVDLTFHSTPSSSSGPTWPPTPPSRGPSWDPRVGELDARVAALEADTWARSPEVVPVARDGRRVQTRQYRLSSMSTIGPMMMWTSSSSSIRTPPGWGPQGGIPSHTCGSPPSCSAQVRRSGGLFCGWPYGVSTGACSFSPGPQHCSCLRPVRTHARSCTGLVEARSMPPRPGPGPEVGGHPPRPGPRPEVRRGGTLHHT